MPWCVLPRWPASTRPAQTMSVRWAHTPPSPQASPAAPTTHASHWHPRLSEGQDCGGGETTASGGVPYGGNGGEDSVVDVLGCVVM